MFVHLVLLYAILNLHVILCLFCVLNCTMGLFWGTYFDPGFLCNLVIAYSPPGRGGCQSALWDCSGDEFAAMLKMRPPKQSHNARWQPSRPGVLRKRSVCQNRPMMQFDSMPTQLHSRPQNGRFRPIFPGHFQLFQTLASLLIIKRNARIDFIHILGSD